VAAAEIGVATPIDPGSYRIEASAPGRKKWTANLDVPDRADNQTLEIPNLELLGTAPPQAQTPLVQPVDAPRDRPVSPASEAPSRGSGQRALGIGVGIAGVVGVGVGTYFGLRAKSKNDDAAAHCVNDTRCDATGVDLDDQARTSATASTIAFSAGGALLAIGAALYFTAPNGNSTSASFRAESTPRASSIRLTIGKSF
jgi:hypothetical protein